MVRWYHAIFTAYGFWLPNDPRGSWSEFVGAWEFARFGGATKTDRRRSLAHDAHDGVARRAPKAVLKLPPVRFDADQRRDVAEGVARAAAESGIVVHAAVIGFDYVHAVVARHDKRIEQVVGQFKDRATQAMRAADRHPLRAFAIGDAAPPTPWAEGCWSVFINDAAQLRAAIASVERHPAKEGLAAATHPFVTPYAS